MIKKISLGLNMLIRVAVVILLALGVLFWTGHAENLLNLHILVGLLLVLSLWTLAILGAVRGAPLGMVGLALLWGLLVPVFGGAQTGLLPSGAHWVIQVGHLLIGLIAVGIAESMGAIIRRRSAA